MGREVRRLAKKKTAAMTDRYRSIVERNRFVRLFDKVRYELPILAVLLVVYALDHEFIERDMYNILHIFDYRVGFAPRLLIGSLMSLFTAYKSAAFMNLFFNVVCLLSIALFAFAAGRVIRRSSGEARGAAFLLVLLFLAVPYSRTVFFPRLLSLERFLALFTLLALMAVSKKGFRWLVPLLIAASLATYHGYAFTYMPAVALVLLYEMRRRKNSRAAVALCVAGFACMAAFSAYFYLHPGLGIYGSVDELINYSLDKTDIRDRVGEFGVRWALDGFSLPPRGFWDLSVELGVLKNLRAEFSGILLLSPLLAVFVLIWLGAVKNSEGKVQKFLYILCMLTPLMRLPMLVLSQNYFRSRVAMVAVQFALLFYMLYIGDEAVAAAARRVTDFLRKYYVLTAALFVYFLFFVKLR